MRFRVLAASLALAAGALATLPGCSSDPAAPAAAAPTKTTVKISAAQGGTVADPQGRGSLVIPPGALAADVEISLEVAAASGDAKSEVFTFGPDGLKFTKPATLSVKAGALAAPEGMTAVLAVQENGKWTPLAGSKVEGGTATGQVEHFSSFAIVFIDGKAVVQPSAACPDLEKFNACGGNPVGTWRYGITCAQGSLGADPFQGKCPTYKATFDLKYERDVVIDATTIVVKAGKETITSVQEIPLSCVAELAITDCASLQSKLLKDAGTCADKGGGVCTCTQVDTKDKPDGTPITYTKNGGQLTLNEADKPPQAVDFCVQGPGDSELLARTADAKSGVKLLYTLKKK